MADQGGATDPSFGRAAIWVLCAGAVVLAISVSIRHAFGLFLQPMSAGQDWGREVFALAIAVQNLVWGIAQPFAGRLADRYGDGRVIAGGAVLYAAGLALMARATTSGLLMLSAGLLVGLGLAGTAFTIVFGAVDGPLRGRRRCSSVSPEDPIHRGRHLRLPQVVIVLVGQSPQSTLDGRPYLGAHGGILPVDGGDVHCGVLARLSASHSASL